jgi:uncharacterized protein (TIGR01244 family)
MNKIIHITPSFAVTGALRPADFAEAAALGFRSIVSNLPDGESSVHPTSRQEAELAGQASLGFRHIPATKHEVFSNRVVDGTVAALSALEAPVLAHCASGLRSAMAWAAAASRSQPVDCVLAAIRAAGFNLEPVRDELEAQGGRGDGAPIPPALDAGCESRD